MTVPSFQSISILAYSPIVGIRCATGTSNTIIADLDARGPLYSRDVEILNKLTNQTDPERRLEFALWALDNAPSEELKGLIPLEAFILQYARNSPAWAGLSASPALNVIVLDWPQDKGYEVRAYLVGSDGPFMPSQLPFFYEQRRDAAHPQVQAGMPLPKFDVMH